MYHGERFNAITHLVGAALALAGLVVLVVVAARQGDPWKIVSFSLYGTTLFMLYGFSTLYRSLRGRAKTIFRRVDAVGRQDRRVLTAAREYGRRRNAWSKNSLLGRRGLVRQLLFRVEYPVRIEYAPECAHLW